jgi:hypothetical protein
MAGSAAASLVSVVGAAVSPAGAAATSSAACRVLVAALTPVTVNVDIAARSWEALGGLRLELRKRQLISYAVLVESQVVNLRDVFSGSYPRLRSLH